MMLFRSDINALRALAVLVVILFHFGVPGFSGGFVGVDVFFVISGYLMTQIVTTRQAQGNFSLLGFYAARFRRIVPALMAVVVVLMASGWYLLLPDDYARLARHAGGAVLFVSNIMFWREDGYFDQASLEKWLLHTWSLSVEWQFYLLFPVLVLVCLRYLPHVWLRRVFWILTLASLAASYQLSLSAPATAFYLLPTRAWEFLLGGLVHLHAIDLQRRVRTWHGIVGIAAIICSSIWYSEAMTYPSLWPLLPTLGAALSIAARPAGPLLDHRITQGLGTTSYSLYLWHWPVLLGVHHFELADTSFTLVGMGMATLLLAGASYRLIETPFRKGFGIGRFAVREPALLSAAAGLMLASWAVVATEGAPARLPRDIVAIAAEANNTNPQRGDCFTPAKFHRFPECRLGADVEPDTVLWGDSHSDSAFTGFAEAMAASGRSAIYYGQGGCAPALSIDQPEHDRHAGRCATYNREVLDRLLNRSDLQNIFLVARWSAEKYHEARYDFTGLVCKLSGAGKRVFVMTTVPTYEVDVPATAARKRLAGLSTDEVETALAQPITEYHHRHGAANTLLADIAAACGAVLLNPVPYLCNDGSCTPLDEGLPLYFDNGHLNERGSRRLTPLFVQALANHQ